MNDKIKEAAYEHQKDAWEEARDRELINYDTGTGKTLIAIGLCIQRVDSVVVVVPLSVLDKWKNEIEFWADDSRVVEDEHRYWIIKADGVTYYVTTKEWFRDNLEDIPGMEAIVIDECHHFAGMSSQMSKSAIKYCKHWEITYRWLMTGTVYRSSPWDVYRLAQILGYEWHYKKYEEKYFKPQYFGKRRVMTPKDNLQDEMADLVEYIGMILHIEDVADMPDQIDQVEKVPLTKEQEKAIEETVLENLNPVVRYVYHHCIESGWLSGDEYVDAQTFSNHKISRIKEYAEERDKVAVVARYTDQLHYIEDKLNTDKPVFKIWGGDKNREETIEKVQDADECVVLISAGVSEGYELPSINLIVFASMSFSYVAYKQLRGRFLRVNDPTRNVFIHLLSERDGDEESIDEAVYNSVVNEKKKFDLEIYARSKGNFNEI